MVFFSPETLFAQGTAFTYQGRLNDDGTPANGNYDFQFTIYNAVTNGNPVSSMLTNSATAVSNGLFAVTLDFGPGIFTGPTRYLDIGVRTNGSTSAFTVLAPRQLLTPAPYSIFANSTSNLLGSLATTQLNGTLPQSAFAGYTNTIVLTNNGNFFGGTFNGSFNGVLAGNGGNVTNVNVTNLTGVLADNQLPTNTAFVNSNQTFTGANAFTNLGNSFNGSFFGNGLVGWITTNGTTVQAVPDTGYLLTNSQLVTVTLPASPNVGDIVRISGAGAGGWQVAQNVNQSILGNFSGFASSSWTVSGAPNNLNWYGIASSADGTKMVAVFNAGGIYTSTDSGRTWGEINSTTRQWRGVASSADGSKLATVVNNDFIFTSTNSGSTWVQRTIGLSSAAWSSIASSADGTKLVAAVNGGGIYTSTDSGSSWTQQASSRSWFSVASSSAGSKMVAAVYGGGIYTNSGTSWTATSASSANWIAVASSVDGSKLVAAVNGGGIYTSTDSGSSWTHRTSGLPSSPVWSSVASSSDGGKLAATVNGGGIYTSINWGATWTQQSGAPSASWSSITSSADGNKLAAAINNASSGGIYTMQASTQTLTTTGASGGITGGQGTAVELQYIGNGQFMPVSSTGAIWAY
jgi:photosystem II stability/assembly factor-like uncharacterized protein